MTQKTIEAAEKAGREWALGAYSGDKVFRQWNEEDAMAQGSRQIWDVEELAAFVNSAKTQHESMLQDRGTVKEGEA